MWFTCEQDNPAFESVLAGDVLGTAFKGVPKVVGLKLTVPTGFKGNVVVEFKNPDFSSKKFDFCDIKLTKAGLNCPCVERISSYDASNIVHFHVHIPAQISFIKKFEF